MPHLASLDLRRLHRRLRGRRGARGCWRFIDTAFELSVPWSRFVGAMALRRELSAATLQPLYINISACIAAEHNAGCCCAAQFSNASPCCAALEKHSVSPGATPCVCVVCSFSPGSEAVAVPCLPWFLLVRSPASTAPHPGIMAGFLLDVLDLHDAVRDNLWPGQHFAWLSAGSGGRLDIHRTFWTDAAENAARCGKPWMCPCGVESRAHIGRVFPPCSSFGTMGPRCNYLAPPPMERLHFCAC